MPPKMQGLHHQQQQLAALLSVALPKDDSTTASGAVAEDKDEPSSRISALNSLHRAILYPPNSLLVSHSAAFLAQGFSGLLSDKSLPVRQLAARVYGALCSVASSIQLTPNGRQNQIVLQNLVDHFMGWALPLLGNFNSGEGMTELALEALLEFVKVGDVGATERYALPILKACQGLLEDERMSMNLLHQLLSLLTMVSLKFPRCFQPLFADFVDLLLGWALVPDLADTDRHVIMDNFLQFQKQWVSHFQLSLGLLSKFLGDIDVLLQDGSSGTLQQFRRLLALLFCFSTVLQSTASGMLEMNLLEQIKEPVSKMVPRLLGCLSLVGKKFGWSKWIADLWRCLTLLVEILGETFSSYYPLASDVLFRSLEDSYKNQAIGSGKLTTFEVHGVLKTNLQLLSLQKSGLLPSSVVDLLQLDKPLSQLRLHPNHLVTGSSVATYFFLLQHSNSEVVEQAIDTLIEELLLLKGLLGMALGCGLSNTKAIDSQKYSTAELSTLIKFDLKVLLSCIYTDGDNTLFEKEEIAALYLRRSEKLLSFIIEKLNPFDAPIERSAVLQQYFIEIIEHLSTVELLCQCALQKAYEKNFIEGFSVQIARYLNKYNTLITRAIHSTSPLVVKLRALEWIHRFCEVIITKCKNLDVYVCVYGSLCTSANLVHPILDAALDKEPQVRMCVASVLELLLRAKLVHPGHFCTLSAKVLERLGDPEDDIKTAFLRLLSQILPITLFLYGLSEFEYSLEPSFDRPGCRPMLHWEQIFALKQTKKRLHSQQLVSILSYLSQRWKVPLSSWIQRLICCSRSSKDSALSHSEDTRDFSVNSPLLHREEDENFLETICVVNNLAGAFWAVHEAARYCVLMRLRTNLGGPTQTFAALERMLLDIVHVMQIDTDQQEGNLNVIGSSGAHLLPMRLLLDFVEALKKNVLNAYEGSVILAPAARQSSLFFRANKKVCEEWFSRICEPMMNVGLALQCHDATIHYCTLRLSEIKNLFASALADSSRAQTSEKLQGIRNKFSRDVMRMLRHMALALCRCHDAESLIGLMKWAIAAFSLLPEGGDCLIQDEVYGPFSWITGLVYQAQGQYEKAAAHFTLLLQTEESLTFMGSEGIQFAISRIIESYTSVSDWRSLDLWLSELQSLRAKNAGKTYSGALTMAGNDMNAIHALAHFDHGDYKAAWSSLNLTPKSSNELTLEPRLALHRSEQMLLQAMLHNIEGEKEMASLEIQKAKSMMDKKMSILPLDGQLEAAEHVTQLLCIFAFEEGCKLVSNGEKGNQKQSIVSSYFQSAKIPINKVHQDCNLWLKLLRVRRAVSPRSPLTLNLTTSLLKLARKQNNFGLANRLNSHLRDYLSSCSANEQPGHHLLLHLQYESALLMHAENNLEDAITKLWSLVRPCIILLNVEGITDTDGVLKAKACLKFADWLRKDPSLADSAVTKMHTDILCDLSSMGNVDAYGHQSSLLEPPRTMMVEDIIGMVTKLSSHLCPTMGKSWISYATWCLSQAKRYLSTTQDNSFQSGTVSHALFPEILPGACKLSDEEKTLVVSVISQLFVRSNDSGELRNDQNWDWVVDSGTFNGNDPKDLVHQVVNAIEVAAAAPGVEQTNGESPCVTLRSQLLMLLQHANINVEEADMLASVNSLMETWWSLRRRKVSLFGHAAHGFLKYLSYSSSRFFEGLVDESICESIKHKAGSYTMRATLYVLHILLNYGPELKDTLEPALATVPLLPWQEITPQLFARLSSHPELLVRKQLEGLLIMLAKNFPWSIVYPALVDVSACEKGPSDELQNILGCLSTIYPRLVQDVKLMISELGNFTILWEELWVSTLQDLHTDVMRRINLLKEEAARIAENVTLSQNEKNKINAAKYSAMMAPVVVTLERRLASTSRKPETPHEIWFLETYCEQIKSAILSFKTPPASTAALREVWRPFSNMVASLAAHQKKNSVSLGEVAPKLALLSSSDVPMPGHEKYITIAESDRRMSPSLQGIVTIASFSEKVTILSTKTKPKKIVILGSDGESYTYLLKGREDLRLDARVMQLLQAINGFLHSPSSAYSHPLGIRYYSVTPISGRAGLIQWVDNAISIYSIYKSWQNRNQLAQLSANGTGDIKDVATPSVPQPSDMFYGKIIPALKEKGIRRVISRKGWPHDVKRKVFLDLLSETPRQLLYQELWCASEGFRAFNSKLKRYSGSVAAMSMVGHVLGLGDRHLDNILIDLCRGDIVHIDYNICFEKGLRLKIPEIVPFRLTQTIEAALGLTGLEGNFRLNCEAAISVLRKNKDIILMLLEVFVWDPLVEWTRGEFHDDAAIVGEERKGMEMGVSLSLFASRVQEIRVPLQEHHDLLLTSLPATEITLERFAVILHQYESVSAIYYHADQERCNLIMRENSVKSIVVEATSTFEKICASFEMQAREFSQAKSLMNEHTQEASSWLEEHGRILDALRSTSVPEINISMNLSSFGDTLSLIAAVTEAKVPLTIIPEPTQALCQDIDKEVSLHMLDLGNGLSSAINTIQAYSVALQKILPPNYVTTSPVHGWIQVLQRSLTSMSSEVLAVASRQAAELITKVHGSGFDSIKQKHLQLCFTVEKYAEQIETIDGEIAQLQNVINSGAELNAKDRLVSAFVKFLQSAGFSFKEDHTLPTQSALHKHEGTKGRMLGGNEEKTEKVLAIFNKIVAGVHKEVKNRVINLFSDTHERDNTTRGLQSDPEGPFFYEFEEQVEKCALVAEFIDELQEFIGIPSLKADKDASKKSLERVQASTFRSGLLSCKSLIEKLTNTILPIVMKSIVSYSSEVMDAFGSVSQMRGSIDTALKQLVEVERERATLEELDQTYLTKVELISEQQLALEEASMKGRDHLSWEEAEELASQEEACRTQLHQLRQTWNQKDMRSSSLMKREANIRNALISSEGHFRALTNYDEETAPHVLGRKSLLCTLVKPFDELESIDKILSSSCGSVSFGKRLPGPADLIDSEFRDDNARKIVLLKDNFFFIWKVGLLDSFLDCCVRDASSSVDQNSGLDQLYSMVKQKVEILLQRHVGQYLQERIVPVYLAWLDQEMEQWTGSVREYACDQVKKDANATRRIQLMLEEYCSAHETARTAKSAASRMKRQLNELRDSLCSTCLEIIQMEWMHDAILTPSRHTRIIFQKNMETSDNLSSMILHLSRPELLGSLKSTLSTVAKSVECLRACEQSSINAEGQLERSMGWACGGPNTSSSGNTPSKGSGIPPEFHEHLLRRRQILWEACEKASNIMKLCMSVIEFEVSRDSIVLNWEDNLAPKPVDEGKAWQQAYLKALTRLDISYHSFKRIEQEWMLAQSNLEVASSNLLSATNELCIASLKAKKASGDLQSIVLAMRDCAYEASVSLSTFARAARDHTALTTECGSMLEEVLAITEGLHDVHNLGKEAALVHRSMMEDISKVNKILLPLESMLAKDVAAMTEVISKERDTKMEVSPVHGQAIYQSYCVRIREASQTTKSVVPTLTSYVRSLYMMLTRLARTASLHAGTLHKALEGVGESDEVKSQEIDLPKPDFDADVVDYNSSDRESISKSEEEHVDDLMGNNGVGFQATGVEEIVTYFTDVEAADELHSIEANGELKFLKKSQDDKPSAELIDVNRDDTNSLTEVGNEVTQLIGGLALSKDVSQGVNVSESKENPVTKDEVASQIEAESAAGNQDAPPLQKGTGNPVVRGKNSYAMSVLRRVELKLDGRDVPDRRESSISEQVDYLLKQATSVDNLCNMYEGWTPWI